MTNKTALCFLLWVLPLIAPAQGRRATYPIGFLTGAGSNVIMDTLSPETGFFFSYTSGHQPVRLFSVKMQAGKYYFAGAAYKDSALTYSLAEADSLLAATMVLFARRVVGRKHRLFAVSSSYKPGWEPVKSCRGTNVTVQLVARDSGVLYGIEDTYPPDDNYMLKVVELCVRYHQFYTSSNPAHKSRKAYKRLLAGAGNFVHGSPAARKKLERKIRRATWV